MIINDLIREYMQYNNYSHSLSVLTPEAGMSEELLDRNLIAKKLKIVEDSESRKVPLLYGLNIYLSYFAGLVFGVKRFIA
jgi:lisH domain-containing protein FOPNL